MARRISCPPKCTIGLIWMMENFRKDYGPVFANSSVSGVYRNGTGNRRKTSSENHPPGSTNKNGARGPTEVHAVWTRFECRLLVGTFVQQRDDPTGQHRIPGGNVQINLPRHRFVREVVFGTFSRWIYWQILVTQRQENTALQEMHVR